MSAKDTFRKAQQLASKEGISNSLSQLIVNLVKEYVRRNENIIENKNPLNIQYHSSSSSNSINNNNNKHKPETLDEMLDQVNEILYGFMTDYKDNLKPNDFTIIEACLIQIQQYVKKAYFESRHKEAQYHYESSKGRIIQQRYEDTRLHKKE